MQDSLMKSVPPKLVHSDTKEIEKEKEEREEGVFLL